VWFRAPIVSETEVAAAEEVLRVEEELIANTRSKESFLECSKTNIVEKLIGFRFGMQDRKSDAKEAAENLSAVEVALKSTDLHITEMEVNVSLLLILNSYFCLFSSFSRCKSCELETKCRFMHFRFRI
jgi:hypothetical protein